jgi:glycyl-tRNA synthetase beta chain
VEGGLEIPLLTLIGDDAQLRAFFEERIKYYFKEIRGFAYDEVNACMAAGWSNLVDLQTRLERVRLLRASPDFEPLAASFKRIKNILDQAKCTSLPGSFINDLLEPGPEAELWEAISWAHGRPIENVISKLRPKIDLFFDKVMVNVADERLRQNRLWMLYSLREDFSKIADFSEIVTNS